jgi:molybdenum-dependent DNA-binding transcriptional regulator ModE
LTELEQFQDAIAKQGSIRGAARALGVEEAKIRRALKAPAAPEPKEDFSALRPWATPRQLEILDAVEQYRSQRAAAKALGIGSGTVGDSMAALKRRAAKMGYAPAHDFVHAVPDGFVAHGVSTYYNEEGRPTAQWVKASADKNRQEELLIAAAKVFAEEVKGLAPITPAPHGRPAVRLPSRRPTHRPFGLG